MRQGLKSLRKGGGVSPLKSFTLSLGELEVDLNFGYKTLF